jgi:hypothetical protein
VPRLDAGDAAQRREHLRETRHRQRTDRPQLTLLPFADELAFALGEHAPLVGVGHAVVELDETVGFRRVTDHADSGAVVVGAVASTRDIANPPTRWIDAHLDRHVQLGRRSPVTTTFLPFTRATESPSVRLRT